jgi:transposase InsO family protein
LVIVDNGTRRCLGLPMFTAGVHVTANMVVAALRALWPPGVQFVISDNGAQFIAEVFQQCAQERVFLHVRIAPHRACTNGIAERFVRTLKEWLEGRSWHTPEELAALLVEFIWIRARNGRLISPVSWACAAAWNSCASPLIRRRTPSTSEILPDRT